MNSVVFNGAHIAPSKIVCAGRNYRAHIEELGNEVPGEPVFFLKPNSAIGTELIAASVEAHHFEAEITFLFQSGALAGVGFGLDLTRRETQARLKAGGLPWERAKSFDGAALFSEFVPFDGNFAGLSLRLCIDGKIAQRGGCDSMLHGPDALLADAASFLTFEDGDLLMTGTPGGVGPVPAGARFAGAILRGDDVLVECAWLAR